VGVGVMKDEKSKQMDHLCPDEEEREFFTNLVYTVHLTDPREREM
jgi:hypothetical protein